MSMAFEHREEGELLGDLQQHKENFQKNTQRINDTTGYNERYYSMKLKKNLLDNHVRRYKKSVLTKKSDGVNISS